MTNREQLIEIKKQYCGFEIYLYSELYTDIQINHLLEFVNKENFNIAPFSEGNGNRRIPEKYNEEMKSHYKEYRHKWLEMELDFFLGKSFGGNSTEDI